MKSTCYILSALISVTFVASLVIPPTDTVTKVPLLGENSCTWGPSFWCSNLTNAKSCNAVHHCIKQVWEVKTLPPDHDSVCDICLKMVGEARAQLESNETQEELKEVFEGSCKLIPLPVINKECIKLVDEFIPELVETLASQMNPQMVCSVAGLCNNPRIDALLAAQKEKIAGDKECKDCHTVMKKVRSNFDAASRDQVLQGILGVCGKLSSFSDACTNIILSNFDSLYQHLQRKLNAEDFCIMSGSCYLQFHQHADVNVEITPLSESGKVDPNNPKEDLPCELCEQLVKHLRDLLVANTTESEFQRVLEGLCKQTGKFKTECLSIVDEYYPQIYNFLMNELNSNQVCLMIGICQNDKEDKSFPYAPLLPVETADKAVRILGSELSPSSKHHLNRVQLEKASSNVRIMNPEVIQLPIERMMPPALTLAGNTKYCAMCQYFLHFVQEEISSADNEEKIKKIVEEICDKMPKTIDRECVQFVDTYGDAVIALLAQSIDPSQICPLLSLCPAENLQEVEVLIHSKPKDKPNCPLCLFAVQQLEEMIKNEKTEVTIRNALGKLCDHLPKNLAPECNDFVKTYTDELIEMLISDFTPQEVCVYLKLCDASPTRAPKPWAHIEFNGESDESVELNNEIPDDTVDGKSVSKIETLQDIRSPQCVICEYVMSKIEDELKDRTNEEHVKQIVHNICNHLPKSIGKDCNSFVDKYGDMVIQLLIQTMDPAEICSAMGLCSSPAVKITAEIYECAICETVVTALDKLLDNPNVDHKIEHVLKKACLAIPTKEQEKCKAMIDTYGDSFFNLVKKFAEPRMVCNQVGLCAQNAVRPKRAAQVGQNKCSWGPAFWCSPEAVAHGCAASKEYCDNLRNN